MASKGRLSRSSAVCLLSSNAYASDASLSKGVYRIFRSPNGYVYASNGEGLFELASRPTVRARLVHGPIRWKQVQSYFELGLSVSPIQAVGRDGSLWASTPTKVRDVHPDGTATHAMRFVEPPNRITMPLQAIPLTMTRDGAVWAWGKTIRIDNSDRIQVLTLPQQDEVGQLRFGSDSSLWLIIRDARNDRPLGVVNVVPAVLARHATAWPFKVPARAGSPTPCPFPTTPPTPVPPLPPKVARSTSSTWPAGRRMASGDTGPVGTASLRRCGALRFAPVKVPVNITIDPAGRHLYVGTWSDGIFAYAIDARSGTLVEIRGSPFAAAMGPTTVVIDRSDRYAFAAATLAQKTSRGM